MLRIKLLLLYISLFITASACELSSDAKEKLLNGFYNYLIKVPDQHYNFQDASLKSITEIGLNTYKLEAQIKDEAISDSSYRCVICTGTVHYDQDSILEIYNDYQCHDDTESNKLLVNIDHNTEQTSSFSNFNEEPTIESTASSIEIGVHHPVKLDNEVQTEPVTSGEQFVAIRRDQTPCIGCASQVNPDAEGVVDLAILGVNQLNFLESNIKHKLNKVVNVERQVQVVNGIRYILTILIDYNSCEESVTNEVCAFTRTCKVAVLDKPWVRLPDGSKYRVVVSNNCTKSWLFDENDHFVYDGNNPSDPHKPTTDDGNSPNLGVLEDIVKAVHNKDVQAQPEIEKSLTDKEIKNIEQQIISNDRFDQVNDDTKNMNQENLNTNAHGIKLVSNIESVNFMSENSTQSTETTESTLISDDKKKAIDDLLNFFDYAGFDSKDDNAKEVKRLKRSFGNDLNMFNLAENFHKMRKSIDNAKLVYNYAQSMVDYLNENDINVKNRILSSVLSADEEVSGDKHFFYILAHIVIPCEKIECDDKDSSNKICNGIIDTSIEHNPGILGTFCYNDNRKKANLGTTRSVPVNDPLLLSLADTALRYIETHSPDRSVLKIIKILNASTQKTSGRLTRISMLVGVTNCKSTSGLKKYSNCSVMIHLGSRVCEVTILERKMLKEKEISFVCTDRPIEESFTNMGPTKDGGDSDVFNILQEALQLLEIQSNKKNKQVLLSVKSVSTELIAGLLTNIEFVVGYTTCDSSVDVTVNDCILLVNEPVRYCNVELWQRPWLIDGRQVKVSCKKELQNENDEKLLSSVNKISANHSKGYTPSSLLKKDSTDPHFTALAEEALTKYLHSIGSTIAHRLVKVDKVATQPQSGLMIIIDFTVTNDENEIMKCCSKILEQIRPNQKDIDVDCKKENKIYKFKRGVPGGLQEQNVNDAQFKALAEESLQKYMQMIGSAKSHRLVTVDRVTTQVVSGVMTRLDFTVTNDGGDNIKCNSEVWEQSWHKIDIKVDCRIENKSNKVKRGVPGGLQEQNVNDAQFKALAEESLQKYVQTIGSKIPHRLITVDRVTTQVVSGKITRLEFTVTNEDGDNIKCNSEVWERIWLNKKEIDVKCVKNNTNNRRKRQVTGGLQDQDASDARFKVLAEESLQKYMQMIGSAKSHRLVTVDRVTTQVVSGVMTRLDFTVTNDGGDNIKCNSEVWEQSWHKKDIKVDCRIENKSNKVKREVLGGLQEQNVNDAQFKALAEESLQKYVQTIGSKIPHRLITVDRVTTQVVSGKITRLEFTVTNDDGDNIKCNSEVWERIWLNKKEIDVKCVKNNTNNRRKRQVTGGLEEQDARDARFKVLAEESLQKYVQMIGSTKPHRLVTVDKVATQIVSGVRTLIDFTITNDDNDIIKCYSNIWEQSWLDKKDIDVSCLLNENLRNIKLNNLSVENNTMRKSHKHSNPVKRRREIFRKKAGGHHNVGSSVEQDPKKHVYSVLADESLQKYVRLQKSKIRHKVLDVTRVVTKVVSGIKYEIDYTAVPTKCSANVVDVSSCEESDNSMIYYCHAKIWDRPWLHKKNIDISCIDYNVNENQTSSEIREKRGVLGGHQSKDVEADQYKELAEAATRKFEMVSQTKYYHKVDKITDVEEQVVAGFVIKLKFVITPTTCLVGKAKNDRICPPQKPKSTLSCSAQIMERPTVLSEEDISVTCKRKHIVRQNNKSRLKRDGAGWSIKGRNRDLENEIDDDIKYYYADRAIQFLNERSNTDNLQKLITIHDTVSSIQMKTHMVRMYLETAYTYCLRHDSESDLSSCDELDGTSHRLCYAKIFPSDDDELIVEKVNVVCDDDEDFRTTTGLSIPDLLKISLVFLEDAKDAKYKLVHRGEPNVIPSLHSHVPVKLSFVVAATNCSKHIDVDNTEVRCFVDTSIPDKVCHSYIWMIPTTKKIIQVKANCSSIQTRVKRELNASLDIQDMLLQSLEKIEMSSLHRYKLRVLNVNSYSTKITTGRVTTIDFDAGYTNCLKHEWVDNETRCEFLEHLPRRHCISEVWERLWLNNGRNIEVTCQDDETPLESHIEFESAETATKLADQALKHIEAKYPHPKKQGIVRIFSLEKQLVAGLHYRMKIEVGFTNCTALSLQQNCQLVEDGSMNRFCRVNVWVRSWTDHPPNYRVTCDFQSGATSDLYHTVQAEQLFYYFITTYRPEYVNDHVEMTKRFEIFRDNVKKIHELNTHEKGTATYAVTRFADLSYEEFRSKYLGLKPSLRNENDIPIMKAQIPDIQIPDSFDWRESDAVTDVKDQGSCGSCWAFSVTGNIEGQWKLKTGQLLSLSEQELVDCDKLDNGCDGGYMDNAYRAIEQLGGLETEDAYPYEGEGDKCSFNRTLSRVQISGAVNITTDETKMAQWLVKNGPISIGINANAMQFYVGGVSHPWSMLCNPKNLDHGVLLVGYGIKDYPLFHKKLPYWIVKNSWGTSWGEQGYYRVFRGDGTCGVNQMASSALL